MFIVRQDAPDQQQYAVLILSRLVADTPFTLKQVKQPRKDVFPKQLSKIRSYV